MSNKPKPPKFEVGDEVFHKPDLYDQTKSKVESILKVFAEIDEKGNFIIGGMSTLENTISSIAVPYTFDGETLTVHSFTNGNYTSKEKVSKFKNWAYVTTNSKMNTIYSEKQIKKNALLVQW